MAGIVDSDHAMGKRTVMAIEINLVLWGMIGCMRWKPLSSFSISIDYETIHVTAEMAAEPSAAHQPIMATVIAPT